MGSYNNFTLEFKEKSERGYCWHHNNGTHQPNTNGYITVIENCTKAEAYQFECFVNKSKQELTNEYILQCVKELNQFKKNLVEFNMEITDGVFSKEQGKIEIELTKKN